MWKSAQELTDWASVCQTVTGNLTYLNKLGTPPKAKRVHKRPICGWEIGYLWLEHLNHWKKTVPEVVDILPEMMRAEAVKAIWAHVSTDQSGKTAKSALRKAA